MYGQFSRQGGFQSNQGISGRNGKRRVFPTAQVAHVWAQQTQEEGRNAKGSIYFRGATIYSYGEHWPLATFVSPTVVLINEESRSVTTNRHLSKVRNALCGLSVHAIEIDDANTIRAFVSDKAQGVNALALHLDARLAAQSARYALASKRIKWDYRAENYGDTLERRLAALRRDCEAANDTLETVFIATQANGNQVNTQALAFDLNAAIATIETAWNDWNAPEKVAKRAKAKAARGAKACIGKLERALNGYLVAGRWERSIASRAAWALTIAIATRPDSEWRPLLDKLQTALAQRESDETHETANPDAARIRRESSWRQRRTKVTPEQWLQGFGHASQHGAGFEQTLVRKKGDTLQTSRGEECPFAHAIAAYRMAEHCMATRTEWRRNGKQIRVGVFQVDEIDASGNLKAGCHDISFEAMRRLALQTIPDRCKFFAPAIV